MKSIQRQYNRPSCIPIWGKPWILGFMVACVGSACGNDSNPAKSAILGTGGSGGRDAGTGNTAGDAGSVVTSNVAKGKIGDQVFNEDEVQSYYLTFSDEEYAKLTDLSTLLLNQYTVNADRYVQASLRVGDTVLPSIGVRYKGNYTIWGCVDYATGQRQVRVEPFFGNIDVCQRFSLKLDFDRYDDSSRLDGLKKLNLHAMAADPSKLRERLGYSLFRDMDVLAPRAVHARVYINGQYSGLYAAVEEIDGRFTANRFPASGNGNLYRDLWPVDRTTSADAQKGLRTNDDPATLDVSDFLSFKDAVTASTKADFATRMAPFIDFDYLARYIVVDRAINNYDGIMAFYGGWGPPPANANHFWYHDSERGRFMLIPWDFDKTFWYPEPNFWSDNAPNGQNVVPNWNVITKNCNGYTVSFDDLGGQYGMQAIDCDPFLRLLRGQIYDSQKAITDAFIAGPFSETSVRTKLDAWQAQIAPAIDDDPGVDSTQWQTAVDALHADLSHFQGNVSLMMSGLISE